MIGTTDTGQLMGGPQPQRVCIYPLLLAGVASFCMWAIIGFAVAWALGYE